MAEKVLPIPLPTQVRLVNSDGTPTREFHQWMFSLTDWIGDRTVWEAGFSGGAITANTTFAALPLAIAAGTPGPPGAFAIVGGNHVVVRDAGTYRISVPLTSTGVTTALVGGLSSVATAADIVQVSIGTGQTVTAQATKQLAAGASVYVTAKAGAASPVKAGTLTLTRTGP